MVCITRLYSDTPDIHLTRICTSISHFQTSDILSACSERGSDVRSCSSLMDPSRHICMLYFKCEICRWSKMTHVWPVFSAWNTESHPNFPVPRAGTIVPSVRPSKSIGSASGPEEYAKVHSAQASFVEKPTSMLLRPLNEVKLDQYQTIVR